MSKRALDLAALLLGLALTSASSAREAAPAPPAEELSKILRSVDRLRAPVAEGRMRVGVTLVAGGTVAPEIPFAVEFSRTGARRVETLGGPRKGQRVLLTDDAYWLYMPGTASPIRLTPLQRMLGQASFGDIGRLRFAEDYRVQQVRRPEPGQIQLRLTARDQASAYRDVELTVDSANHHPLRAVFLYPSGKIFKTVYFGKPVSIDGYLQIQELRFVDPNDSTRYSLIRYTKLQPAELPANLFTPAALRAQP
jgi:hypothetical protein